MKKQNTKSNLKNVWLAVALIFIINLIVSGSLWAWQNSRLKSSERKLDDGNYKLAQRVAGTQKSFDERLQKIEDQLNPKAQSIEDEIKTEEIETNSKNIRLENGDVYYTNKQGIESKIAKAVNDSEDPTKNTTYIQAKISPNENFIILLSRGWEWTMTGVYDIASKKSYYANFSGFSEWLPDNRLKVTGECGMGSPCGIYESIDAKAPWVLKKVSDGSE